MPVMRRSAVTARPSVGPQPPRFLVGALVKSVTGRRGEVVEVYQDERRVLASDGTREWFHADQLVARRPKAAKRTGWRRARGGA